MKRPPFLDLLIRSAPFRVFQLTLGITLMLVAPIIGIPTPGPLGIFIFAIGFGLVLRNSRWARRQYVRYTRRYPRVQRAVNFGLRRKSKRQVAADPVTTDVHATDANCAASQPDASQPDAGDRPPVAGSGR